ncbi:MAG: hypothetical protein KC613_20240, partial [Myxococcales bacterium]|nr:hypothetical protein [Myxococcales bacterium]
RTTRDSFNTGKVSTLVPGKVTTTADLQLPTLGNPGDLDRYAGSLKDALEALWPAGGVPERLVGLQAELAALAEQAHEVEAHVTERRVVAGHVANEIEQSLRPLERAIEALELERAALENSQAELQGKQARAHAAVKDLDAAYAVIYGQVEAHQSKLFARAGQDGGEVDFRDLFREDVEAQLGRLSGIFADRAQAAARLSAVQDRLAALLPRIADVRLQLHELNRSRLKVEARRVSELARLEFEVTATENRLRGLERAREHRALELGLAFRRAVNRLIDARDRR